MEAMRGRMTTTDLRIEQALIRNDFEANKAFGDLDAMPPLVAPSSDDEDADNDDDEEVCPSPLMRDSLAG